MMTRKRNLTEQIMAIDSYLHCILHLQLQIINIPSDERNRLLLQLAFPRNNLAEKSQGQVEGQHSALEPPSI